MRRWNIFVFSLTRKSSQNIAEIVTGHFSITEGDIKMSKMIITPPSSWDGLPFREYRTRGSTLRASLNYRHTIGFFWRISNRWIIIFTRLIINAALRGGNPFRRRNEKLDKKIVLKGAWKRDHFLANHHWFLSSSFINNFFLSSFSSYVSLSPFLPSLPFRALTQH